MPNIEYLFVLQEVAEFTHNAQHNGERDEAQRTPAATHQPEHGQGINQWKKRRHQFIDDIGLRSFTTASPAVISSVVLRRT